MRMRISEDCEYPALTLTLTLTLIVLRFFEMDAKVGKFEIQFQNMGG